MFNKFLDQKFPSCKADILVSALSYKVRNFDKYQMESSAIILANFLSGENTKTRGIDYFKNLIFGEIRL